MKYTTSDNENEILPNKLGLTDPKQIGEEEYRGFLKATIYYQFDVARISSININLIHEIHRMAFGHIYEFAGTLRSVNMSKGGFPFPAARYLPQICQEFEQQWLMPLTSRFDALQPLIAHLSALHGEMLYIHPYREGNGRTARLFVNLMLLKHGYKELRFERITQERMPEYIAAVQSAAGKNYEPMLNIFNELVG